jgi:hypothetical protein
MVRMKTTLEMGTVLNQTTGKRLSWVASCGTLALGAFVFCLSAGCTAVGSSDRHAGKTDTELRGVLALPATNAPADVVAVLQSRSGTYAPCNLRTSDGEVAEDLRTFAAKDAVVIVTGEPGADGFTVTAIRADGKPRKKGSDEDADAAEKTESIWPHITWGSVPVQER